MAWCSHQPQIYVLQQAEWKQSSTNITRQIMKQNLAFNLSKLHNSPKIEVLFSLDIYWNDGKKITYFCIYGHISFYIHAMNWQLTENSKITSYSSSNPTGKAGLLLHMYVTGVSRYSQLSNYFFILPSHF